MKCLIVDDELLAQEVIESYIAKVDSLVLVGKCSSALQAFAALNKETVDLMFMDIKMPEMTGLEFLRTLKQTPKVIITTAFHEYALDGFELDVVDYLLKPIPFNRFLKAVNKVKPNVAINPENRQENSFYVRSDRKLIKVNPEEIIFIEALKNYLCIYMPHQKVMVHSTMLYMEEQLANFPFIHRVHKSFLVNKHFIKEIDNGILKLSSGAEIPLGGLYKDAFLDMMRIL
ncbi:DNA-binding response regulator [Taibaiella sp. KBW10]|uniref:LytR/AlgR family response regulator transcription factor n=1 Tax=Taibaiella sp. KBW10 TaxID=2153357 RepID=UPI000F5A6815|nr:LytTR family DNA-binding domain-containing protein [Taibaiella sp. KBW10]RQO31487.1 DNA-binding response regulator [Taibaiella sp. KBW10]